MLFLSFLLLVCFSSVVLSAGRSLQSNETELLAYQAVQTYASLPALTRFLTSEIKKNVKVAAIPGIFAQQKGVLPEGGSYQLENFGALKPWSAILQELSYHVDQRLLIMIRHAEAQENLNPTPNSNCEFTYNGATIQNFDSPLSDDGITQAKALNELFRSSSTNPSKSWYETIGLTEGNVTFVTSPLSRTLQTTEFVFDSLPLTASVDKSFIVDEIIRAAIGRDVCNYRHNVKSSTSLNKDAEYPFQTGCKLPDESLEDLYEDSVVNLSFPIRPPGGSGFGLFSDSDLLWRSDIYDEDILENRALAFLSQVKEYTPASSVIAVVTHGEVINAVYKACGEVGYKPKNTEVVPLVIKF
jgi:broad specificity phosphatase PhoE